MNLSGSPMSCHLEQGIQSACLCSADDTFEERYRNPSVHADRVAEVFWIESMATGAMRKHLQDSQALSGDDCSLVMVATHRFAMSNNPLATLACLSNAVSIMDSPELCTMHIGGQACAT